MKYRVLGKSHLKVSVVGIGTWQFGGEWGKTFTQPEVTAILGKARDLGINVIDTAECYGDHTSEALIGQALKELNARSWFIVATKFGHKFHANFERSEPRRGRDIEGQLEESLRALQTDHIDLYQYHSWGDAQFASDEVRTVLDKAGAAGKIHHVGNSVGPSDNPNQVAQSDHFNVEVIQVVYNRLNAKAETEIFPLCHMLHLGVLARVPLASGFLSGKYKPGTTFPETEVRGRWRAKNADEMLTEVERIQREELPAGANMAEWALAWCLRSGGRHPVVTAVIPGCKSVEQVESNARAAKFDFVLGG